MTEHLSRSETSAIAVCETCGMPIRVTFRGDEIVKVLAPCGHVKKPEVGHSATTVRPFDSGSQYVDWQCRNCFKCAKYDPDQADPDRCRIDFEIGMAYIGDGQVPLEIAQRMGAPLGLFPRPYSWPCPEREDRDDA